MEAQATSSSELLKRFIAKLRDLIGHKWKDLAHQLGFAQTEIDAIEYNGRFNLEEQIFKLFHKWQQQKGQDASVEMLVEGLKAAKLQAQLDSLEKAGLLPKVDRLRSPSDSVAERELVRKKRLERFLSGSNKSDTKQESPGRVEAPQAVGITSPTLSRNDDSMKQELNLASDSSVAVSAHLADRPFEVQDMVKVVNIKGGAWVGVIQWIGCIDKFGDRKFAGLDMDKKVPGGGDGEFEGKRYFTCPSGHGLFLPVEKLQRFNPDEFQSPELENDTEVLVPGIQKSVQVSDSDDQVEKDMDKAVAAATARSQSLDATLPENTTPMDKPVRRLKSFPDSLMALLQGSIKSSATAANDDEKILAFMFPGDRTGLIIGKDGQNIREVEEATNTKIHIDKPRHSGIGQNGHAYIVGKKVDCKKALLNILENLKRKIDRHVATTETMTIQNSRLCGRIIGSGGSTRRAIESLSGARVKIDQKEGLERWLNETATCRITGSAEQIERAKILIQDAMQGEDIAMMATVVAVLSVLIKEFKTEHGFEFDSKDFK